jgi:hypothetical protein
LISRAAVEEEEEREGRLVVVAEAGLCPAVAEAALPSRVAWERLLVVAAKGLHPVLSGLQMPTVVAEVDLVAQVCDIVFHYRDLDVESR